MNRHLQMHKLHQDRRRSLDEHAVANLEQQAEALAKRQRSIEDGWKDFTDSIGDAWDALTGKTSTSSSSTSTTSTRSSTTTTRRTTTTSSSSSETPTTKTDSDVRTTNTARLAAATETSKPLTASVGVPASIVAPTVTSVGSTAGLAIATDSSPTVAAITSTPTSTPQPTNVDDGSSAASKAGIAFGVIGGLLVVFMAIWFIMKKRRDRMDQERLDEDEKTNSAFAVASTNNRRRDSLPPLPPSAAPRLSLRPESEFSPNLNRDPVNNNNGTPAVYPKNAGGAWERPRTGNNPNHPANPFGNHAERIEGNDSISPVSSHGGQGPSPVSPVDGATAAAGMLTRKQSIRKDLPTPLDLTVPPPPGAAGFPGSPAGTEYSMHEASPGLPPVTTPGAAAIAAAGGPAQSAVHRVQLDFKPTMEDEMELKAGTLVRLLHEYDDGWALCIRLDRSQQGVVPRTCLSTRPVKPRPNGPGPRPGPPISLNRGMDSNRMSPPQQYRPAPGFNSNQRSIERKPVPNKTQPELPHELPGSVPIQELPGQAV